MPIRKNIYLDHAATTYLDPKVEALMRPYLSKDFGNPSSLYALGVQAKFAIEDSRKKIARLLDCRDTEIVFTAGGTESVNLAIFGAARERFVRGKRPHFIVSAIEHHSVLKSVRALEQAGALVTVVPVDRQGFADPKQIAAVIKKNTVLVSVMYANNEVGTIEPIAAIAKQIRKANLARKDKILFHTDACQAGGVLNLNVNKLGVDLMSLNASKIYGPKQIGCLYVRGGVKIEPLIYGGGQERGLRSGTENVPAIVGFAEALALAQKQSKKENARLRKLRNYFIARIQRQIRGVLLNGPEVNNDSEENQIRLPNNVNISITGIEGEALLLYLDARGIAVSTGSACASTSLDPSHVILALGRSRAEAKASIRITLGKVNKKSDLDYVLQIMPGIVKELRRVQSLAEKTSASNRSAE